MSQGTLRVRLFGSPRILAGDELLRLGGPPGTIRLFAYLLLARGDSVDRAAAAAALWPDCSDYEARANLRRHIGYLERALQHLGAPIQLVRNGSTVGLDGRGRLWVDVNQFLEAVENGRFEEAALLYSGDLLTGHADEWIASERDTLRRRHVENLTALVDRLELNGEPERALHWALELRRIDRFHEETLRTVMRLRAHTGDRIGALREYRDFVSVVRERFAAEPSQATRALYREIAGENDGAAGVRGVVPAELTTFYGREADLNVIQTLIDVHRLVTLVGPPGVGKTRLSVRTARALQERFRDGVWFVELASLDGPQLIEQRVLQTLDRGRLPRENAHSLDERLRSRELLLILDNAEHLLKQCATLANSLLRALPELTVLVTSRAPLGVDGETVARIAPLELPEPAASNEEIARNTAVRLFLDRAIAAAGDAGASDLRLGDIADVCRRLDGLPLALEFAAARVRAMTVRQIKSGLDSRFRLLARERHTAMAQHRTLYGSFDWSYRLLSPTEQSMFRALSIFRGGWTLEAAACVRAVAQNDNALDVMTTLLEASLVSASATHGAEARYDFLESTRAFASEQLRDHPAEFARVQAFHAQYFADRFITRDEDLRRARAHEYFAEIDREHDNIRAALAFLLREGNDPVLGMRLALAVSRYWFDRGYAAQGAEWISLGLRSPQVQGRVRSQAMLCLATITRNTGDYAKAYAQFDDSLDLLRRDGDAYDVIKALLQLSDVARVLGNFDAALPHAAEALALCEAIDDRYFAAFARATLGCVHLATGALDEGRKHFTRALEAFDAAGASGDAALVVNNLGLCSLYGQQPDAAAALCQQALERSRLARYDFSTAHALHSLTLVNVRSGNTSRAGRLLERAIVLAARLEDRELSLMCVEATAEIALAIDAPERAATLAAAAESGRARFHAPRAPIEAQCNDDLLGRVIAHLEPHSYAAMYAIGSLLSLDAALGEARRILSALGRAQSADLA